MTPSAQELKDLQATPRLVRVADRELKVAPLRFGQLPRVLELVGPAIADFGNSEVGDFELLARHADRLLPLIALLTGAEQEWLAERDLAEVAPIVAALIEVNSDFFVNQLVPALGSAASQLTGRLSSLTTTMKGRPAPASAGPTRPSA